MHLSQSRGHVHSRGAKCSIIYARMQIIDLRGDERDLEIDEHETIRCRTDAGDAGTQKATWLE